MYKIGIIGHPTDVLCFLPLGFSALEANDAESAVTVAVFSHFCRKRANFSPRRVAAVASVRITG